MNVFVLDLPFVLAAGLLGSAHCIGMCGPFALTIGSGAHNGTANTIRQSVYSLGRLFTYAVFGTLAGFAGKELQQFASALTNTAAILAVVAGIFLIYQGLLSVGLIKPFNSNGGSLPCLGGRFLATFLKSNGLTNVFLAGLFTGMLPCGLLYGIVALAASSSNPLHGALIMIVFGLGTVPMMVLTGCSRQLVTLAWRKSIHHLAAWCVIVAGCFSLARGIGFIGIPGLVESGCIHCQ